MSSVHRQLCWLLIASYKRASFQFSSSSHDEVSSSSSQHNGSCRFCKLPSPTGWSSLRSSGFPRPGCTSSCPSSSFVQSVSFSFYLAWKWLRPGYSNVAGGRRHGPFLDAFIDNHHHHHHGRHRRHHGSWSGSHEHHHHHHRHHHPHFPGYWAGCELFLIIIKNPFSLTLPWRSSL